MSSLHQSVNTSNTTTLGIFESKIERFFPGCLQIRKNPSEISRQLAEADVSNNAKNPMVYGTNAATIEVPDESVNVSNVEVSVHDTKAHPYPLFTTVQSPVICHILPDGTHVPAPPPSDLERTRFFERSVARHGLLREDLEEKKGSEAEENDEANETSKKGSSSAAPQIHPLARASALLQANGINELNRAINLHTLVATGEYFSLSNIVDPSLDPVAKPPSSSTPKEADGTTSRSTTTTADGLTAAVDDSEARVRAVYILQRQRDLFRGAASSVQRHRRRLQAAIAAQQHLDRRWWTWRRRAWRLAAPEHGTRARPHPVAATAVLCADVDVYQHDSNSMGRLARQVPRYATLQLSSDYKHHDGGRWSKRKNATSDQDDGDAMDVDINNEDVGVIKSKDTTSVELDMRASESFIVAQPYVVADQTVAKVNTDDLDASKVTMLTLQFAIENTATGYCERVCIEEPASLATVGEDGTPLEERRDDEKLLMALQHSLFCAKLFESMRRELAPDTDSIGQVRSTASSIPSHSVVAWLTGQSEKGNFLPAPSMMLGAQESGLNPICVVHVHEGDFKVLLDCEYTLHVQLVESKGRAAASRSKHVPSDGNSAVSSGSQSPQQLLFLCRALLLHAQDTYHRHSIRSSQEKKQDIPIAGKPNVKAVLKTKDVIESFMSLQKCISLGAKLLFEARIRKTLRTVKDWLRSLGTAGSDSLHIEWLMLSVFDLSSQFTVTFRSWSVDVAIVCDELTVTRFGSRGDYRKVKFHSDKEFELYLKTSLRRLLQPKQSKIERNVQSTVIVQP
jgi:hypothetical protein